MLLRAAEPRADGSIAYSYETTWPFTWEDCAAFLRGLLTTDLITDRSHPLRVLVNSQDITNALYAADLNPAALNHNALGLPRTEDHTLQVEGHSRLMESTLRFTVRCDVHECLLEALSGSAMHESDHVFDRYMDNLEIIAHIERVLSGAPRDRGTHHADTLF
ncbi:hypothetical protein [Schaalia sp. Marseille-Q2122]|uniref:hypothetical protein n=1 Tax=Schaalia sp. Marseille-Q2122 TaxID=2736604 RepID=UPI001588CE53|nr:hypothetical protein [Schaalia sp. Marseille-Q2122]